MQELTYRNTEDPVPIILSLTGRATMSRSAIGNCNSTRSLGTGDHTFLSVYIGGDLLRWTARLVWYWSPDLISTCARLCGGLIRPFDESWPAADLEKDTELTQCILSPLRFLVALLNNRGKRPCSTIMDVRNGIEPSLQKEVL